MIRDFGLLPSELHRGKKCGCWFLGRDVDAAVALKKIVPFFSKKKAISKPSNKMSSTTGSSATMFLADMI